MYILREASGTSSTLSMMTIIIKYLFLKIIEIANIFYIKILLQFSDNFNYLRDVETSLFFILSFYSITFEVLY